MTRKLASPQKIKQVRPIEGAENIECVGILGWECVSKKGESIAIFMACTAAKKKQSKQKLNVNLRNMDTTMQK